MLRALRAQQVLLSDAYLKRVAVAASTDVATIPARLEPVNDTHAGSKLAA
jgi:hypothetical protein